MSATGMVMSSLLPHFVGNRRRGRPRMPSSTTMRRNNRTAILRRTTGIDPEQR